MQVVTNLAPAPIHPGETPASYPFCSSAPAAFPQLTTGSDRAEARLPMASVGWGESAIILALSSLPQQHPLETVLPMPQPMPPSTLGMHSASQISQLVLLLGAQPWEQLPTAAGLPPTASLAHPPRSAKRDYVTANADDGNLSHGSPPAPHHEEPLNLHALADGHDVLSLTGAALSGSQTELASTSSLDQDPGIPQGQQPTDIISLLGSAFGSAQSSRESHNGFFSKSPQEPSSPE